MGSENGWRLLHYSCWHYWVGGSKKVQKCANVIYGWSLRVPKSSPMACGAEPNCFRAVSCFTLEPSFFSFLPHLDTNFRSRSPLGPFSNFHVIALLTFEAKTISLLVWYAQTSTSTSMTFNYCISIRFVFFSFYLSPYLWTIGPNRLKNRIQILYQHFYDKIQVF